MPRPLSADDYYDREYAKVQARQDARDNLVWERQRAARERRAARRRAVLVGCGGIVAAGVAGMFGLMMLASLAPRRAPVPQPMPAKIDATVVAAQPPSVLVQPEPVALSPKPVLSPPANYRTERACQGRYVVGVTSAGRVLGIKGADWLLFSLVVNGPDAQPVANSWSDPKAGQVSATSSLDGVSLLRVTKNIWPTITGLSGGLCNVEFDITGLKSSDTIIVTCKTPDGIVEFAAPLNDVPKITSKSDPFNVSKPDNRPIAGSSPVASKSLLEQPAPTVSEQTPPAVPPVERRAAVAGQEASRVGPHLAGIDWALLVPTDDLRRPILVCGLAVAGPDAKSIAAGWAKAKSTDVVVAVGNVKLPRVDVPDGVSDPLPLSSYRVTLAYRIADLAGIKNYNISAKVPDGQARLVLAHSRVTYRGTGLQPLVIRADLSDLPAIETPIDK